MIEMDKKNKPEGIMEDKATKDQMEILKKHFAGVSIPLTYFNEQKLKGIMTRCPVALLAQLKNSNIVLLKEAAKLETTRRGNA